MKPGDDKSIDRKMQFIPVVPPTVVSLGLVLDYRKCFLILLFLGRFTELKLHYHHENMSV